MTQRYRDSVNMLSVPSILDATERHDSRRLTEDIDVQIDRTVAESEGRNAPTQDNVEVFIARCRLLMLEPYTSMSLLKTRLIVGTVS